MAGELRRLPGKHLGVTRYDVLTSKSSVEVVQCMAEISCFIPHRKLVLSMRTSCMKARLRVSS